MFTVTLSKIFIVFLLIAVGFVLDKKKFVSREALQSLSRVVIYIMLPALIFSAIITQFNREAILSGYILPLLGVMTFLSGGLLGWILVRFFKENDPVKKNTVIFLMLINNYGFITLPLVYMLFGESGVALLFLHNLGCEIVFWTVGMWLLKGGKFSPKTLKSLVNPPFISLMLSIGIVLLNAQSFVPAFLLEACDTLGKGVIPLIMLVIGSTLAEIEFRDGALFDKKLIWIIVSRIVVVPIFVIIILLYLPIPEMYRNIAIIVAVMPSASSTPLFMKQFGGDTIFAAKAVFFTTLLSAITIPILLTIFLKQ
ncbi:MAG: AEC family transporter [Candidatus Ancaeobacter aquaticus]|nr:AEC family transporter [Candidatus Ancaeobacter aquaticus]